MQKLQSYGLLIFFFPLTDFEASFIRLLDKLTNGSRIEINQTGKHLPSVPKNPYVLNALHRHSSASLLNGINAGLC